jgi:hypothetical protein
MPRIDIPMSSPEGVAPGQTATFKLPIGRRFHLLQLLYGGGSALVDFTEIRVLANAKVIHRYSATDRDAMNQFDGRAAAAGILVLPFDRYFLNTLASDEETALNTGPAAPGSAIRITSLHVEVDILPAAPPAVTLAMNATVSDAPTNPKGEPVGPGTVMHILRHTRSAAGAGSFEISDLPAGTATSMALNRIFFNPSANLITRLEIERNQYKIFDRTDALNRRMQADGVRTPIAGWYAIDKTEQGYGGDPIDLLAVADYRYRLAVSGAMAINVYSEYLGRLGD